MLDRTTGEEIRLEQLFDDADTAIGAMERIIEDDVLPELSDYMEYSELLPMPRDAYAVDEYGLTVFYPDDSYRYFDEQSGAVQFAWHELAAYIGESSPVYEAAHAQGDMNALTDAAGDGRLPGPMTRAAVGQKLGEVLSAYTLLTDPDYTKDSAYICSREASLRGWAVEIPKYAETDEAGDADFRNPHHARGRLRADRRQDDEGRADRAARGAAGNEGLRRGRSRRPHAGGGREPVLRAFRAHFAGACG